MSSLDANIATGSPTLPGFSERSAWKAVGPGWRPVFASFHQAGFSFEWHDFAPQGSLEWGKSFHPQSLEICLNLEGEGRVGDRRNTVTFGPESTLFYFRGNENLKAERIGSRRHRFLTVELSLDFLRRHLMEAAAELHPLVRRIVKNKATPGCGLGGLKPFSFRQQQTLGHLMDPPVLAAAQPLWFQAKALELASEILFDPKSEEELFCLRQKRVARERTEKVIAILKRDLTEPPSLEKLGREAGCSPYYLSRIFSREIGMTIPQYLRKIRMERAAELLRSGKYNVTETALMVGYNSMSHFSQSFCQTIGCCPNLYPKMMENREGRDSGNSPSKNRKTPTVSKAIN